MSPSPGLLPDALLVQRMAALSDRAALLELDARHGMTLFALAYGLLFDGEAADVAVAGAMRIAIRGQLVLLAVLCGVAACTDHTGPTAPAPPSSSRVISCQADVRARILACAAPNPSPASGISADLVLGGQGAYVALRSSNVSYNGGITTFQADVTVENLTAQPLGTPDGNTVTGVKVFFSSGPTVTSGTGTV